MATTAALAPESAPTTASPASEARARLDPWGLAGSLGLLGLLYAANLRQFVNTWSTDANYSHGFLVPALAAYFAREASKQGPVPIRGGAAWGVSLILASILAHLATILVPVGIVGDLGFLLGLAGVVSLLLGGEALKRYRFPLAFLVFMVPLPVALYATLASPLQRLVSQFGAALLNGVGIPVLCEGNMMTLPGDVHMFVAEACSGMRQMTGFLALTTAVAYLSGRPAWYRAVLVLSSVPIAMTANVLRVMLTGVIMYHFDPKYASGEFHTFEGLLMMGVGLGLLALECAVLKAVA